MQEVDEASEIELRTGETHTKVKGEVENSEFSENSETSENQFSEVFNSEFSILHYTQNGKLGVENLGVLFQAFLPNMLRVFPTPSFPFCTIPKTENSEMKTSECSFKPFYQTPSFSNSEFSILHYTQNEKLGVGNLGVFSKVYQNSDFFKLLNQTPRFSNSEFSILRYTQNGKLGDGKPRSLIRRRWRKLRGFHFRVFRFECSAKWKSRSWKTPRSLTKVPQSLMKLPQSKSPRFSTPTFRFWV